ncbi:MAG: hypothetical protein HC801_11605 [Nitrospira sp.]|nr:hypothetical protein [Nitrospira sp.]
MLIGPRMRGFRTYAQDVVRQVLGVGQPDPETTKSIAIEFPTPSEADGSLGYFQKTKLLGGLDGIIAIAKNPNIDPRAILHHEMLHAMRAFQVFTKVEWKMLKDFVDKHDLLNRYNVKTRWKYVHAQYWQTLGYDPSRAEEIANDASYEEAIAETLAEYWIDARRKDYSPLKDPRPPLVRRVLDKIVRFLTGGKIKLIFPQATNITDVESLFRAALRGELANREIPEGQREEGRNLAANLPLSQRPAAAPGPTVRRDPLFDFNRYDPYTRQGHWFGAPTIAALRKIGLGKFANIKGLQFAHWAHKFFYDIRQMAQLYPEYQPLQNYMQSVLQYHNKVMDWLSRADTTSQVWGDLGTDRGNAVGDVMFALRTGEHLKGHYWEVLVDGEVVQTFRGRGSKAAAEAEARRRGGAVNEVNDTRPRMPTPEERAALYEKYGIAKDEEAQQLIERVQGDFHDILRDILRVRLLDLNKLGLEPDVLAARQAEVQADINALLNQPYFPLVRFGQHLVVVRKGKRTIYSEQFEKEEQAEKRRQEIEPILVAGETVTKTFLPEEMKYFQGIPPSLVESIKNRMKLSEEQIELLGDMAVSYLPSTSFLQRLRRAAKTPGFSRDGPRVYATYFNSVSRFLAKIEFAPDMQAEMDQMRRDRFRGGDTSWIGRILDYTQWHYENRIRAPASDWQICYFPLIPLALHP